MFKTKYCSVFSKEKKVLTKIFPFFLIGIVISLKKGLHFQVCPNIFKFARIRSRFARITSKCGSTYSYAYVNANSKYLSDCICASSVGRSVGRFVNSVDAIGVYLDSRRTRAQPIYFKSE